MLRKPIMQILRFFILILLLSLGRTQAADFIEPSADLSAQEVVEIQLLGLQAAGTDRKAGIEQVWRFAHPDNRKMTGPIGRFSALFDLPAYAPLIGLQDYVINEGRISETQARFVVTVRAKDGAAYGYIWVLRPVRAVLNNGAQTKENDPDLSASVIWMTSAVSAPYAGGAS